MIFNVIIQLIAVVVIAVLVYIAYRRKVSQLREQASVFDNMPVAYFRAEITLAPDGSIESVRPTASNLRGDRLTRVETDDDNPYSLFSQEMMIEKIRQVRSTGEKVKFNHHFDKTDDYYLFRVCPTDSDTVFDVFGMKVTGKFRDAELLRIAAKRIEMTLNAAHIIPWSWDMRTHIIEYSISKSMLEASDSERIRTEREEDFFTRIHRDDLDRVRQICHEIISGSRHIAKCEFRILNKVGKKEKADWYEVKAVVAKYNEMQRPDLLIGSVEKVTLRKREEARLRLAEEEAKESARMKSAFIANMSHDIRTPLNAIVGFSNLLIYTTDKNLQRKYVSIIEANNMLMQQLVSDVLDMAKVEAGQLEFINRETNLNELMSNVETMMSMKVRRGVELRYLANDTDCVIETDPNRLQQVLMNLVSNACKCTESGSIIFGYEVRKGEIYFYVRDTGCGISPENQRLLFRRFVKLNKTVDGTGLGLSICQNIIEKMNGSIGFDSKGLGMGSTFWFTIPCDDPKIISSATESADAHAAVLATKTSSSTATAVATEPTLEATPLAAPIAPPAVESGVTVVRSGIVTAPPTVAPDVAEKPCILVAEDNEGNYMLFESFLGEKYRLIHAWDGVEVVALFETFNPQLILMDINMPRMDGYEATKKIREKSTTVPIIAVTAYASAYDRDRIIESGCNDFVSKPVNFKKLAELIESVLNG